MREATKSDIFSRDRNSTKHSLDGLSLDQRNPNYINSIMPIWEWLYRYYFRVETDGWHHIPETGRVLLVGSHNGGIATPDMFMCIYDWFRHFGMSRPAYGLAHPAIWKVAPAIGQQAAQCGAIQAKMKMAIAALQKDAAVLVYPGGAKDVFRPYSMRHSIHLAGHKGFIKLALQEESPIIPIISKGAHETLIVLADFYNLIKQLHEAGMPWLFGVDPEVFPLYLGLPWGLGIGPIPNFPIPSQIHTRICAPITFKRYGRDASHDSDYINLCYEAIQNRMQQELDRLVADKEGLNEPLVL